LQLKKYSVTTPLAIGKSYLHIAKIISVATPLATEKISIANPLETSKISVATPLVTTLIATKKLLTSNEKSR
jgi:hypothetical protein